MVNYLISKANLLDGAVGSIWVNVNWDNKLNFLIPCQKQKGYKKSTNCFLSYITYKSEHGFLFKVTQHAA